MKAIFIGGASKCEGCGGYHRYNPTRDKLQEVVNQVLLEHGLGDHHVLSICPASSVTIDSRHCEFWLFVLEDVGNLMNGIRYRLLS